MTETISDFELSLSPGYAPKLRDASLDWLNCGINYEIGDSVPGAASTTSDLRLSADGARPVVDYTHDVRNATRRSHWTRLY